MQSPKILNQRLTLAEWWPYTLEDQRLEPTNHPFRKENDLNQTSMIMFHVNLQGCTWRRESSLQMKSFSKSDGKVSLQINPPSVWMSKILSFSLVRGNITSYKTSSFLFWGMFQVQLLKSRPSWISCVFSLYQSFFAIKSCILAFYLFCPTFPSSSFPTKFWVFPPLTVLPHVFRYFPRSWRIIPVNKWFATMVIVSPQFLGLWDPFQLAVSWLTNWGHPNSLLTDTWDDQVRGPTAPGIRGEFFTPVKPHWFPAVRATPWSSTSWWLNQPIWKIWVKMGIFPRYGVKKKIFMKPPPSPSRPPRCGGGSSPPCSAPRAPRPYWFPRPDDSHVASSWQRSRYPPGPNHTTSSRER